MWSFNGGLRAETMLSLRYSCRRPIFPCSTSCRSVWLHAMRNATGRAAARHPVTEWSTSRSNSANCMRMFKANFPMLVAIENCWVTLTMYHCAEAKRHGLPWQSCASRRDRRGGDGAHPVLDCRTWKANRMVSFTFGMRVYETAASVNAAPLDVDALIGGTVAKVQAQGEQDAERLREAMRKALSVLQPRSRRSHGTQS